MMAYTYKEHGKFELTEKPLTEIINSRDAIVKVTMSSICSSDLHIKHGSVPRAVPGITVGHEMVGIVEKIGSDVRSFKIGDRVTVNVETFCGEILSLIEQGKIDTTPLITRRFPLKDIEKAYDIFENKLDGVIKIAVTNE